MKKILLIIFIFIPVIIKASVISGAFINSKTDISGNLIVEEIIELDEYDKPVNIYYKNELKDKIYESSGIKLNKIGILDKENISKFYDENFEENYIKEVNNYTTNDDGKYLNINFKESGLYYIKYTVLNVCVKHNDSAELYYKYLHNFNYEIRNLVITFMLPEESKLFDTWAHSSALAKVTKDSNKQMLVANIKYYKNNDFDYRVLYDKDIFSIVVNKDRESGIDAIDKINQEEKETKSFLPFFLVIFVFGIILLIAYSNLAIDVTHYEIKSKKIKKNLKLLVFSDLHDRDINNRLISIIEEEKPDKIIFAGDMVDGRFKNIGTFLKLCDLLEGKEVYYTYGNHEYYLRKDFDKFDSIMKDSKINLLNDKKTNLTKDIVLNGLICDLSFYRRSKTKKPSSDYIKSKLGDLDENKFNILVAHNPLLFESYARYGFDLVISGHVHGGVIILPFLGGLLSPEYRFFPKYYKGLYKIKNSSMIVSRGLGFARALPIRFNNPAEVVVINIMKN